MRSWLLAISVFLCCPPAEGQQGKCPDIPIEEVRKCRDDYKRDETEVKSLLKWLCKTPYGIDVAKRADANYYILQWLSGNPEMTLNVHSEVLPPGSDTTDLLFSLIHGMLLYKMEHPKEIVNEKLHVEGLKVVVFLAEQSETYGEKKELRPLFKASRKKQLNDYVKERLLNSHNQKH
jgi:hypothetical protein